MQTVETRSAVCQCPFLWDARHKWVNKILRERERERGREVTIHCTYLLLTSSSGLKSSVFSCSFNSIDKAEVPVLESEKKKIRFKTCF